MKAKDLKPPFQWADRRVLLEDRILHVPPLLDDYKSFIFPPLEEIFENSNPVTIEYCSGNGDWIAAKAKANPDQNFIAVEKQFRRVRKIWAKGDLRNLFIICGEAHQISSLYLPSESISGIYINFPDPWPKKRHAKHRLIHRPFLDEMARILQPGAAVTFVSDDRPYVDHFTETADAHSAFSQTFVKNDLPGYGDSWFDTLWRKLGREISYVRYTR